VAKSRRGQIFSARDDLAI